MQDHTTKYDLARHAAQWGADQELEACCTEVAFWENTRIANLLRESRRPKPLSLKEQALEALKDIGKELPIGFTDQYGTVLRALEQIDD